MRYFSHEFGEFRFVDRLCDGLDNQVRAQTLRVFVYSFLAHALPVNSSSATVPSG